MAAPQTSTIVIECPNCGTRYQLPPEAIGPKGREVACAHCGSTWQAKAEIPAAKDSDVLFDAEAEAALDEAFAAAERTVEPEPDLPPADEPADGPGELARRDPSIAEIKAAIAPRARPAGKPSTAEKNTQKAFAKRQAAILSKLPLARARRGVRVVAVSALVLLLAGVVTFRTEIVRQVPDLALAYAAVGLGVNVLGLEFRDVTTLMTLRNGSSVMQVDARIYNVAGRRVRVTPVVVTLVDEEGAPLYEWSVAPDVLELEAGEAVDFTTQLTSPPQGAARVRLAFTDGKAHSSGAAATAAATGR